MERKPIPVAIETAVLVQSARRCALCFHLANDLSEKLGQIAHIDRDSSNANEDNLVFLCLNHHTLYDSRSSQHKNYTPHEVRAARQMLYEVAAKKLLGNGINIGVRAPSATLVPALEILWIPGEATYHMYYGRDNSVLHFRICVVNPHPTRKITNVSVRLEELEPPELQCVPCFLRLMNDIKSAPDPYRESFDLAPAPFGRQFVDLLVQDPNENQFWVLHTVHQIPVLVKKQAYRLRISAIGDNAEPALKMYELKLDGRYWHMTEAGQQLG